MRDSDRAAQLSVGLYWVGDVASTVLPMIGFIVGSWNDVHTDDRRS